MAAEDLMAKRRDGFSGETIMNQNQLAGTGLAGLPETDPIWQRRDVGMSERGTARWIDQTAPHRCATSASSGLASESQSQNVHEMGDGDALQPIPSLNLNSWRNPDAT
ncbi:hypothetical protein E4U41_003146 [Claviceps citrina]|nr:hypothetical protein E4U41_003146 [Claviceps citrina]